MATLAKLLVKLGIDAGGYTKGVEGAARASENSFERIERAARKLSDVGAKLTLAATTPLVAIGTKAVMAASDTAESVNKMNVTFGKAAASVDAFAKTAATGFGMSRRQAIDAASSFGGLFTTMGVGKDKAAEMSVTLAKLAADLGSFYNLSADDALAKLKSGLVGETEPLRAVNVLLNETAVANKAVEMGLAESANAVSEQAKVMARYQLILEQTKIAQGDFGNTADSLANRMKTARSNLDNAAATLGEKLIPLAITAVEKVNNLADAFNGLDSSTQGTIVNLGLVVAAGGPVLSALGGILSVATKLGPALAALFSTAWAVPLLAVLGAVVEVIIIVRQLLKEENREVMSANLSLIDKINAAFGGGDGWRTKELERTVQLLHEAQSAYAETGDPAWLENVVALQEKVNELNQKLLDGAAEEKRVWSDAGAVLKKTGDTGAKALGEVADGAVEATTELVKAADAALMLDLALARFKANPFGGGLEEESGTGALNARFGGMTDENQLRLFHERMDAEAVARAEATAKTIADNERAANQMEAAYERAWDQIKSYAESKIGEAQSSLEGLLNGTKMENLPGGNGPGANGWAENIFRAADVALKGDKSEWAAKLGLDQATAAEVVNKFRQGLIDDQVKAVLGPESLDKLVQQVQLASLAEKMKTKFAEEIAAKAGTGVNVVESMLGITKSAEGQVNVAGADQATSTLIEATGKALNNKAADAEKIGEDWMVNLGKGIEKAKDALVKTVEGVANAMLDAMRKALNLGDSTPTPPTGPNPPGFASGTSYAPGGLAWVGERGPELVQLPRGSRVWDARSSAAMGTGQPGSTAHVALTFNITASTPDDVKRAVRRSADELRAAMAAGGWVPA